MNMLMLLPFFAKHDYCSMVCLILEHLLNLSMLDSLNVILVISLDGVPQRGKDILDLSQSILERGSALLAALFASLLQIELL